MKIVVNRNDVELCSFTHSIKDTIIYDSTLSPNQAYTYQVQYAGSGISQSVTAKTMDTTSNNFTWQTYTFGGGAGNCFLYDVSIIDENTIWAVGEIFLNDSTGHPDPNYNNIVKWDGNSGKLTGYIIIIKGIV